ncbi:hypothetical protein HELRODRAFT_182573 [Helobdella robusta]|uniref:C-type lectin domain-containing protein n=1 Tax=Helobdella robusta TaxID=6412 RepID=T1FID7_HELRO|nr:hypothetical protein HELRODRAFT_182573 [Helobdella robusta]ESN90865.1 hypothetical protein HELRODRAFT_182573 [Helobdella robusta]
MCLRGLCYQNFKIEILFAECQSKCQLNNLTVVEFRGPENLTTMQDILFTTFDNIYTWLNIRVVNGSEFYWISDDSPVPSDFYDPPSSPLFGHAYYEAAIMKVKATGSTNRMYCVCFNGQHNSNVNSFSSDVNNFSNDINKFCYDINNFCNGISSYDKIYSNNYNSQIENNFISSYHNCPQGSISAVADPPELCGGHLTKCSPTSNLSIAGSNFSASTSLKLLGDPPDSSPASKAHTSALTQICNYLVWSIYHIRPFLRVEMASSLSCIISP